MRGSRRSPAGSRTEFVAHARANGSVGVEDSSAAGLRHHSLPFHDSQIAPRDRGVPGAKAPLFRAGRNAVPDSKLAGGGASRDVDRHVHVQFLPNHRLHADIWPKRTSSGRTRQPGGYPQHGRFEFSMVADYGRTVGPGGPAAAAFWLYHSGAIDRLSRALVAGRLPLVPAAAQRAALAVIPLWEL